MKEEEEAKRCIETMKASVQKAKKPRKNVMTKPKPIGISTTTITEAGYILYSLCVFYNISPALVFPYLLVFIL